MVKDMTSGSPIKLILSFSIPLFIGQLFQQLYNMVDTIIVGQFVGVDALAAVGSTGSIHFLVIGFVAGLTAGFAIPIAQAFGAGDLKRMRRSTVHAAYLCISIALLLTIVTVAACRPMLRALQTPDNIIDGAYRYIVIVFGGLSATISYNMLAGILRALGDSRTPLFFLILASLLNVGLDLLFIVCFGMAEAGAGLATVLSQLVSAVLCFVFILKKFRILRFYPDELPFDRQTAGNLFRIGLPMAFQFSITAIGSMILQVAVNSIGSSAVAAMTTSGKIQSLLTQPMESMGLTMATYCGQNLGARRIDRIRKGMRQSLLVTVCYAVFGAVLTWFVGPMMSGLFLKAEETSPDVLEMITQYLRINALFFIALAILFVLRNSLQGLGMGLVPMLGGVGELLSRSLVGIFLAPVFGFAACAIAGPIAWIAAILVLIPAYAWKLRQLFRKYPAQSEIPKESSAA